MTVTIASSDSLVLGPFAGAVPSARLHTRAVLAEWGLDELAADAEIVVAELVANAVQAHQREGRDAPVRLTLLAGPRSVLIVVRDGSNDPPVPGTPDPEAERGRGLLLVEALTAAWTWKPAPTGGKVVRASVERDAGEVPARGEQRPLGERPGTRACVDDADLNVAAAEPGLGIGPRGEVADGGPEVVGADVGRLAVNHGAGRIVDLHPETGRAITASALAAAVLREREGYRHRLAPAGGQ